MNLNEAYISERCYEILSNLYIPPCSYKGPTVPVCGVMIEAPAEAVCLLLWEGQAKGFDLIKENGRFDCWVWAFELRGHSQTTLTGFWGFLSHLTSPHLFWLPTSSDKCSLVSGSRTEHFHRKLNVLTLEENVFYIKKAYFCLWGRAQTT